MSRFKTIQDLPENVFNKIEDDEGRELLVEAYNKADADGESKSVSYAKAWNALDKAGYKLDEKLGVFVKKKEKKLLKKKDKTSSTK